MHRIAALLAVLSGALAAGLAQAQVGGLYGDAPPRPPAEIPNGPFPPQPPPVQYPGQPPFGAPTGRPPPAVQSQPLPPPPGAATVEPGTVPTVQRARVAPQPANPAPQPANPPAPAEAGPPPDDTVVIEMPSQKIENGRAVFAGLDKITGRIISFDAAIGETVQFGALRVTARVCYTRPPTESANTDAFVEVDEVTLQGDIKRIFTGWMFASSPGLHAVEHPIYDVWLADCASPAPTRVAEPVVQPTPAAAPPAPGRPRQPATRPRQQSTAPLAPGMPAQSH